MDGWTDKNGLYRTPTKWLYIDGQTKMVFTGQPFSTGCAICWRYCEWKENHTKKNSIQCQMYAKIDDHIKLKLHFNSRHPRHLFRAQHRMQHLHISLGVSICRIFTTFCELTLEKSEWLLTRNIYENIITWNCQNKIVEIYLFLLW